METEIKKEGQTPAEKISAAVGHNGTARMRAREARSPCERVAGHHRGSGRREVQPPRDHQLAFVRLFRFVRGTEQEH